MNTNTAENDGRPHFEPSLRFSALLNGLSNIGQGMMLLSVSKGSPTALKCA
ncbi:hypothetical protein OHAE_5315 [Ochrobactrum soli]|uniref:Uncharacterized protein n=1 Tax=Ochrobactrum soli TaxID=2448455 RepID=A0A2P9HF28_9HYPH|nr:hypothetical protein OHAE_5315 [[Ochrobactrum] soli]